MQSAAPVGSHVHRIPLCGHAAADSSTVFLCLLLLVFIACHTTLAEEQQEVHAATREAHIIISTIR